MITLTLSVLLAIVTAAAILIWSNSSKTINDLLEENDWLEDLLDKANWDMLESMEGERNALMEARLALAAKLGYQSAFKRAMAKLNDLEIKNRIYRAALQDEAYDTELDLGTERPPVADVFAIDGFAEPAVDDALEVA